MWRKATAQVTFAVTPEQAFSSLSVLSSTILDPLLLRYHPVIHGVIVAHSGLQISNQSLASFAPASAYLHINAHVTFLVFTPLKDSIMVGIVHNVTQDAITLKVFGIFHSIILANAIPDHRWSYNAHAHAFESLPSTSQDASDENSVEIKTGALVRFRVLSLSRSNSGLFVIRGTLYNKTNNTNAHSDALALTDGIQLTVLESRPTDIPPSPSTYLPTSALLDWIPNNGHNVSIIPTEVPSLSSSFSSSSSSLHLSKSLVTDQDQDLPQPQHQDNNNDLTDHVVAGADAGSEPSSARVYGDNILPLSQKKKRKLDPSPATTDVFARDDVFGHDIFATNAPADIFNSFSTEKQKRRHKNKELDKGNSRDKDQKKKNIKKKENRDQKDKHKRKGKEKRKEKERDKDKNNKNKEKSKHKHKYR